MKLLVDECLSRGYVWDLVDRGYPDTVQPMNIGLCGARLDQIVARAFAEDRMVITANGRACSPTCRSIPGRSSIVVEALERRATWLLILLARAFVELQSSPVAYMVNRVVEVSATAGVTPYELPSPQN